MDWLSIFQLVQQLKLLEKEVNKKKKMLIKLKVIFFLLYDTLLFLKY